MARLPYITHPYPLRWSQYICDRPLPGELKTPGGGRGPIHRGDNLSRHSPIFLRLRLGEVCSQQAAAQPPPRRMPAWGRATTEELQNYTSTLHQQLKAVKCPDSLLKCQDSQCEQPSHNTERDGTVLEILCAMVETSYTCLPLTGRAVGAGRSPQLQCHLGYCQRNEAGLSCQPSVLV